MPKRGTETEFELTTIERLEAQGYSYLSPDSLERAPDKVILTGILEKAVRQINPGYPESVYSEACKLFSHPAGADTLRRNLDFHKKFTRGQEINYTRAQDKGKDTAHLYAVDWDDLSNNTYNVVNQFPVAGRNERRPDLVIFINGLPLVVFELKNPYNDNPTVDDAVNQLQHYRHDIGQLFEFNALCIASDGVETLHGMWSADREWFTPWKTIDGFRIEPGTSGSMKVLVEGLFPVHRLLDYIRSFIVFEEANERLVKKGARYHQFFAVQLAAGKTVEKMTTRGEKRIGVIWHTTGSGKSLSIAFLVGLLRRHPALANPKFLIQVDRNDLDSQLHDQLIASKQLIGSVRTADSVDKLRELLKSAGGEVICSTIQKFRLKQDSLGNAETAHPILSEAENIIIIADEAHRSQYGFESGFARYLYEALPNACRIGFTGTPINFSGADTEEVFGNVIHTYDIKQAQEDKTTVPIFYTPRLVKLNIARADIDAALEEITGGIEIDQLERKKSRWAALSRAAGASDRLADLAADLLAHFAERTADIAGKALVVCMTRENCVKLYNALRQTPGCPEVKIVMTGNLSRDPEAWSKAGHLTTKRQREAIKERMRDLHDPLKIVIVCDMWLTGTDIPCLHTLYIDKPMRGHNMIQAISRINRVFKDKPHGLLVDFIGIGDELREAAQRYSQGGGRGNPAPDLEEEAVPLFTQALEELRALLPGAVDYGNWRVLPRIELEDRYALVFGVLTGDEHKRENFLQAEFRLTKVFLLVKALAACKPYIDEVVFYQRVRRQINKTLPGRKTAKQIESAIRDLVDDSIDSEGVVDIYKVAGIDNPDLSILDENFLQIFAGKKYENLRIKLLEQLLNNEIQLRKRKNAAKARSFQAMLVHTLQKYHNRIIDAAKVIEEFIFIKNEMDSIDKRAGELGLSEEEYAFYSAVAANYEKIYQQQELCAIIRDVVKSLKKNLKIDWTEPHRADVRAGIISAVKAVLRKTGVRQEHRAAFVDLFMSQAEELFKNWPNAA